MRDLTVKVELLRDEFDGMRQTQMFNRYLLVALGIICFMLLVVLAAQVWGPTL